DRLSILVSKQVLEQDLERERQAGDVVGGLQRVEPEDLIRTPCGGERALGVEGVGGHLVSCWGTANSKGARPSRSYTSLRRRRRGLAGGRLDRARRQQHELQLVRLCRAPQRAALSAGERHLAHTERVLLAWGADVLRKLGRPGGLQRQLPRPGADRHRNRLR